MRIISSSNRWSGRAASVSASQPREPVRSVRLQADRDTSGIVMKGRATRLIHAGETDIGDAVPLTTPIYETSTFVFENAKEVVAYNEGRSSKYLYSRYANPTIVSVERKLAALDSADEALLFSSGQGATTTILMAHAKAGDEIVCSSAIYGGTLHLLDDLLSKFEIAARFVSIEELARPDSVIGN